MANLCHMNIHNILLWLECRLVNTIFNNFLFHCNSHINQMLPQIVHILRFCLVDSLPQITLYWRQGCSVARNMEVHTGLFHYCTFGLDAANDAPNARVDTVRGKITKQQNLSKMTMSYRSVTKLLQTSEDTSNPPPSAAARHVCTLAACFSQSSEDAPLQTLLSVTPSSFFLSCLWSDLS